MPNTREIDDQISQFHRYRSISLINARRYVVGEDTTGVDLMDQTPKDGDMIVRLIDDHSKQWLVTKEQFRTTYEFHMLES